MGGGVLPRVLGGSGMDNAAGRRIPHLDMRRERVWSGWRRWVNNSVWCEKVNRAPKGGGANFFLVVGARLAIGSFFRPATKHTIFSQSASRSEPDRWLVSTATIQYINIRRNSKSTLNSSSASLSRRALKASWALFCMPVLLRSCGILKFGEFRCLLVLFYYLLCSTNKYSYFWPLRAFHKDSYRKLIAGHKHHFPPHFF